MCPSSFSCTNGSLFDTHRHGAGRDSWKEYADEPQLTMSHIDFHGDLVQGLTKSAPGGAASGSADPLQRLVSLRSTLYRVSSQDALALLDEFW
jgi:hypothetical protein